MSLLDKIGDWGVPLKEHLSSPSFQQLGKFIAIQRKSGEVYPNKDNLFNCFQSCSYQNTKVVIFDKEAFSDKYADGLAYSSVHGTSYNRTTEAFCDAVDMEVYGNNNFPPSACTPNLQRLARQGVLLLNAIQTSENGVSHSGKGWEEFTVKVISELNKKPHLCWMLWGPMKKLKDFINPEHLILESDEYPGSKSFKGGFAKANLYVREHFNTEIVWG